METEEANLGENNSQEELKIKGHSYNVKTIRQALELLIECGISFRGIEKVFKLFKNSESPTTPSFTCIRKWLGRMGIYELTREKEYRR
jgi:tRNA U38,U39,U40 pseudouridine synthase TruA